MPLALNAYRTDRYNQLVLRVGVLVSNGQNTIDTMEANQMNWRDRISVDPKVCHGKLTFRGTRILVSGVLELVAEGMDWDAIVKQCHGSISPLAIAEAIRVAGRAIERPVPA